MLTIVYIVIYLLVASVYCAYLFYINYKEDGLGWWAYLLMGIIFGWVLTPISFFGKIVELFSYMIATIMGKIIDLIFGKPVV